MTEDELIDIARMAFWNIANPRALCKRRWQILQTSRQERYAWQRVISAISQAVSEGISAGPWRSVKDDPPPAGEPLLVHVPGPVYHVWYQPPNIWSTSSGNPLFYTPELWMYIPWHFDLERIVGHAS